MKRFSYCSILFMSLFMLLLAGCGDGGSSSSGSGQAELGPSLRISITDAPFSIDNVVSAVVAVERLEIRQVDGELMALQGFVPRNLDLIQLQNGISEVIFEGYPPPGIYDEVRLVSHAVEIVVKDGEEVRTITDFKIPSGSQTGIKVKIEPNITVVTELTTDLMLDYDLSRSFVPQGNSKKLSSIKSFIFKPVVRAVNLSTSGTLTFRVASDNGTPDTAENFLINGALYDLWDDSENPPLLVASGVSAMDPAGEADNPEDQGYVFHPAIPAGTYRLEIARDGYDDYSMENLQIIIANLTTLGTITLQANSASISGAITTEIIPIAGSALVFPLADADVYATPDGEIDPAAIANSDTTGYYELSVEPPFAALYNVKGEKAGYAPDEKQSPATVAGASGSEVDLHLLPLTDTLIVTVMDQDALMLPGVDVAVYLSDGTTLMGMGTTDLAGQVIFPALPTAGYHIEVTTVVEPLVSGQADHDHTGGTGIPAEVPITIGIPLP